MKLSLGDWVGEFAVGGGLCDAVWLAECAPFQTVDQIDAGAVADHQVAQRCFARQVSS